MEHIPETHIRGNLPEEEKENLKKERYYYLGGQTEVINKELAEAYKKVEREKTQQEIAAIGLANKESNKLLIKFGLQPFNIPTENYCILPKDTFPQDTFSRKKILAVVSPWHNRILFKDTEHGLNPLVFGCTAFHETLHLKSFLSFKPKQNDNPEPYRAGISINTLQENEDKKTKIYLHNLNEGITTQMNEEYLDILLQHPEFEKEAKWLNSRECKLLKKGITKDTNFSETDILWVDPSGENIRILGFILERKLLNYICSEILKKKPEKYISEEDVFTEFQRAQITGNILNIARDITHTFGKGSFRKIGGWPEDWRLKLYFETLKLKRKISKT